MAFDRGLKHKDVLDLSAAQAWASVWLSGSVALGNFLSREQGPYISSGRQGLRRHIAG